MSYRLKACPIGTLPLPGSQCFFGRHDPSFHPLGFYIWIVRGKGTLGLVDAGLPPDAADRDGLIKACQGVDARCKFTRVVTIDEVLKRERIAPADIDFVAITQPITYHSGGLEERFFPNAEVYIARAGVLEMLLDAVGHPPREFYFTETSWTFLRRLLLKDRLRLIDGETEIRPGITFESTGGHHPGSAAVRVATRDGVVGILETAFLQRNIDEDLPIGIAEDVAACRRVIKRYKKLCDFVAAGHEPALAKRFG